MKLVLLNTKSVHKEKLVMISVPGFGAPCNAVKQFQFESERERIHRMWKAVDRTADRMKETVQESIRMLVNERAAKLEERYQASKDRMKAFDRYYFCNFLTNVLIYYNFYTCSFIKHTICIKLYNYTEYWLSINVNSISFYLTKYNVIRNKAVCEI